MRITTRRTDESTTQKRLPRTAFVPSSLHPSVALLAIALAAGVTATAAEPAKPLAANDLALIYNANVPASRELAQYYAQRRSVPAGRLIALSLPDRETIEREEYPDVVRQLRKTLRDAGIEDHVRCLVTFHGLPIRIGPSRPDPKQRNLANDLGQELDAALHRLADVTAAMEALSTPPGITAPTTASAAPKKTTVDFKTTAERYQRARNTLGAFLDREKDETRRNRLAERFFGFVEEVEGSAGLIAQVRPRTGEVHPWALQRLATVRGNLEESQARLRELLRSPLDSPQRAEARRLAGRIHGLFSTARYLQDDREALLGHETAAAFDSELMLLWWDDYPLYRWQMNTLAWRVQLQPSFRTLVPADQWGRKVLMVSRLDAPDPAIVRRMIDDAIETERTGLNGTFYIDARGISKNGSYGSYDENLRNLAAMVKAHTTFPTVLDNRAALFGPGQCPDTALYCGWYSLRKYVPAFTFVRGSVGYHIASAEAVSLRGPAEQGWCKRMLEEGIAATLGPVEEPYLHAFPQPKDFFGLLLTGRFSLAEVYACSNNLTSWMMMLLGDPLYRPFAGHPYLKLQDAFDSNLIPEPYRQTTSPSTK